MNIVIITCCLVLTCRILKNYNRYDLEKEAMRALLEGMSESQDKLVRQYRQLNRKLTEEQIIHAREYAINHAIEVSNEKAQRYLESMTQERVNSCIRQLLLGVKQR